ncbi:Mycothiol maleylpyruvate isomerase N-terminal domain protein [Mycobacterium xenopi]|uniref:DinB-like domain-containing protein n=1 Tax=Mycobacterium xenopi TaxID=1789 RepID=A0AAD1M141_MYCXE|nr:hypothetical protein MYXE_18310 [Mycobacterium xenopi]SPX91577.1 Mycothiol maleylpyruvate isomerase N-terminal domain protein [Mycobacterium xenopi]
MRPSGCGRSSGLKPPPDALRERPDPNAWSVIEYVCHLRDVYLTYTIRLHRARTEERPTLEPTLNDLRARRFRYNDRDLTAMLDELALMTAGFCEEIARTRQHEWDRLVTRSPGEQRTARWLFRQAMHEGVHHLADIRRVSMKVTGGPDTGECAGVRQMGGLTPRVAAEAMAMAVAHLQQVDSSPVWRPIDPRDREWLVNQPLPEQSQPLPDLLRDVKTRVLHYPMGNGHRRFFIFRMAQLTTVRGWIAVEPLAAALNPSDHLGSGIPVHRYRCHQARRRPSQPRFTDVAEAARKRLPHWHHATWTPVTAYLLAESCCATRRPAIAHRGNPTRGRSTPRISHATDSPATNRGRATIAVPGGVTFADTKGQPTALPLAP